MKGLALKESPESGKQLLDAEHGERPEAPLELGPAPREGGFGRRGVGAGEGVDQAPRSLLGGHGRLIPAERVRQLTGVDIKQYAKTRSPLSAASRDPNSNCIHGDRRFSRVTHNRIASASASAFCNAGNQVVPGSISAEKNGLTASFGKISLMHQTSALASR